MGIYELEGKVDCITIWVWGRESLAAIFLAASSVQAAMDFEQGLGIFSFKRSDPGLPTLTHCHAATRRLAQVYCV